MGRTSGSRAVVPVVLALALAAAGSAQAAPANAAAYRSQVNALCRSFTVKLKRVEADAKAAQQAGDAHAAAYALGEVLGMALAEDAAIEATPVPADSAGRMSRPLQLLRSADRVVRRALAAVSRGDAQTFTAAMRQLATSAKPVNAALDGAGLRDCGSNQA